MSTIQGQFTVGSQVAFTDGEPDKSRYRLYRVRGDAGLDDFRLDVLVVLTRRLTNGKAANNDLPDLILVDGGKGQLNVARAALKEMGLSTSEVGLAGLAKSRVLEDEARFAARQGFKLADAWAERAGGETEADASGAPGRSRIGRAQSPEHGPFAKTGPLHKGVAGEIALSASSCRVRKTRSCCGRTPASLSCCSGCATKHTGLRSPSTASSAASEISARCSRRSRGSARSASARCSRTSAR